MATHVEPPKFTARTFLANNPSSVVDQPLFKIQVTPKRDEFPLPAFSASFSRQPLETETLQSLRRLENAYRNLMDAIDIRAFEPKQIQSYIQLAERRRGVPYTDIEKAQLRAASASSDPEIIRAICLELRVGIPELEENEALAALGKLLLYREDEEAIRSFLQNPDNDPNIKSHLQSILLLNRIDNTRKRFRAIKQSLQELSDKLEEAFSLRWLVTAMRPAT